MTTLTVYWIAHYRGDSDSTLFAGASGPRSDDEIREDITTNNDGDPTRVDIIQNYGDATIIEMVDEYHYIIVPNP